jgi:16S rRNA (cytosine1402-N4)-methyltransferase
MGESGRVYQSQFSPYFHIPVLLDEVIEWLCPLPGGIYIDCTVGSGASALKILEKSAPNGRLLGIDRDEMAINTANQLLQHYKPSVCIISHGNFSHILSLARSSGFSKVNGMLFDLGISSIQLNHPERGFSFLKDGPLDMRMDQTQGQTAAELLADISEPDLTYLLKTYGEEPFARRIARALVRVRQTQKIQTTYQLSEIIRRAIPPSHRHRRLHFATRTFQAIRIAVNQELEKLDAVLRDAASLLLPGGRICAISFHSLEDRIVKHTFRELSAGPNPILTLLTKKPCTPSAEEQKTNPRSRSAKLRVAERVQE